jgi:hypothetical protein
MMQKCYACWKQASGAKIRKFVIPGTIKNVKHCSEHEGLNDREFEKLSLYYKEQRKNK